MGYTRPEEIIRQRFIDSLRECIGLDPLYKQHAAQPIEELEFGTLDRPIALVLAKTAPLHSVRYGGATDEFRRKSNGTRAGTVFRDGARKLGYTKRMAREARSRAREEGGAE